MVALAQKMPGFLGVESVRDETGFGITSVYWKDKISIMAWRNHTEHKKEKNVDVPFGMKVISYGSLK